jgi:hypothetical protein
MQAPAKKVGVTISLLSDRRTRAGDGAPSADDVPWWLAGSVPPGPLATRQRRFCIVAMYIKHRHYLPDIKL